MITDSGVLASEDSEIAVLGAVILDNSCINEVLSILKPDDFYSKGNKTIFETMVALDKDNKPIDVLTVSEQIKGAGRNALTEVGGSHYITHVADSVPTASNVAHYARRVKDTSDLRRVINTADEIKRNGSQGMSPEELLDRAETRLMEIAGDRAQSVFADPPELAARTLKHIEEAQKKKQAITGLSTGFRRIDELTSGLQPADLIVVAARPSLGKTSFCLNIAEHAGAADGKTVAVFSLEMTEIQLAQRMFSAISGVNFSAIRGGHMNDRDIPGVVKASEKFGNSRILIDDSAGQTALEIRAKCRRLKKDKGLDLVIVDYLQLMRGDQREQNREREIASISSSLKALAKELNVPVIAVSQLSRQTEVRTDRRPQLSDLRESGAIEQDADVVMFIHRPDFYKKDDEQRDGVAEVIIGKQRNGPLGVAKLSFLESKGVPGFAEYSDEYEDIYGG
ncbi:MAG: replicative DNA helicase [Thermodesulfobacteriota bacterium]